MLSLGFFESTSIHHVISYPFWEFVLKTKKKRESYSRDVVQQSQLM